MKIVILLHMVLMVASTLPMTCRQANGVMMGTILNYETGLPVAGAKVGLCYHETLMLKEGLWVGGNSCEVPPILTETLDDGSFRLPVRVDTLGLPTYVWLQVSHPDFETLNEVYIPVKKGKNLFGSMTLNKVRQFRRDQEHLVKNKRAFGLTTGKVFPHTARQLKRLYPFDTLAQLPSIRELMPDGGYFKYFEVQRGYNDIPSRFKLNKWNAYRTIIVPEEMAIAAATEGEIGRFSDHPEALKAQAVWIRTYVYEKALHTRLPQNFQLAFQTTISEPTLQASRDTQGMILSHKRARGGLGFPIQAVFSAQCNGDFTQPGERAKWGPCELRGNPIPYLTSVACSSHLNCHQSGMKSGALLQCRCPITPAISLDMELEGVNTA